MVGYVPLSGSFDQRPHRVYHLRREWLIIRGISVTALYGTQWQGTPLHRSDE